MRDSCAFDYLDPRLSLLCHIIRPCKICGGCQINVVPYNLHSDLYQECVLTNVERNLVRVAYRRGYVDLGLRGPRLQRRPLPIFSAVTTINGKLSSFDKRGEAGPMNKRNVLTSDFLKCHSCLNGRNSGSESRPEEN